MKLEPKDVAPFRPGFVLPTAAREIWAIAELFLNFTFPNLRSEYEHEP